MGSHRRGRPAVIRGHAGVPVAGALADPHAGYAPVPAQRLAPPHGSAHLGRQWEALTVRAKGGRAVVRAERGAEAAFLIARATDGAARWAGLDCLAIGVPAGKGASRVYEGTLAGISGHHSRLSSLMALN